MLLGCALSLRQAFLLMLLVSTSFSLIPSMQVTGSLDSGGSASILASVDYAAPAGTQECISLSGAPDSVVVTDRSGLSLNYTLEKSGNMSVICASVPADHLNFALTSSALTSKEGGLWDFDMGLMLSDNVSAMNITLTLPQGAMLKATNGAVQEEGGMLQVVWSPQEVITGQRVHIKAQYQVRSIPTEAGALLAPALVILVVVVAAYLLLRNRRESPAAGPAPKAQEKPGVVIPRLESNDVFRTLDETDKELVREILRQGGKTTQAQLYLNTHVPKATLSRRMASLESRGLILRSQKGNRNLVSLSDVLGK